MKGYRADVSGNLFLMLNFDNPQSSDEGHELLERTRQSNRWDFDTALITTDYGDFAKVEAYEINRSSPACCGNGLLAVAHVRHMEKKSLALRFGGNEVSAHHIFDNRYEVRLGSVRRCRLNADELPVNLHPDVCDAFRGHDNAPHVYEVGGEPHVVLFHKPNTEWLTNVGAYFAHTFNFNVTIADVAGQQHITAMTFERGVMRTVRSSRTGACAAAYACRISNPFQLLRVLLQQPSVRVSMNSHDLTVHFKNDEFQNGEVIASSVVLEGSVEVVPENLSGF